MYETSYKPLKVIIIFNAFIEILRIIVFYNVLSSDVTEYSYVGPYFPSRGGLLSSYNRPGNFSRYMVDSLSEHCSGQRSTGWTEHRTGPGTELYMRQQRFSYRC